MALDLTMGYIDSLQDELHYGYPIVITETNFQAGNWAWDNNDEGNYLVDLMSYLYDNCYFASIAHCSPGPINPANTQLRVLWFCGQDFNTDAGAETCGLFTIAQTLTNKSYAPAQNPPPPTPQTCNSTMRSQISSLSTAYFSLRNGTCW